MTLRGVVAGLASVLLVWAMFSFVLGMQVALGEAIRPLRLSETVDNVFLPAGVRLMAGLVFGLQGALGVFFATLSDLLSGRLSADLPLRSAVLIALPGAVAPLLTSLYGRHVLGLRADLSNLRLSSLTHLSAVCGLLSSSGHQLVFGLTGAFDAGGRQWLEMWVGDFVGAMLCIACLASLVLAGRRIAAAF